MIHRSKTQPYLGKVIEKHPVDAIHTKHAEIPHDGLEKVPEDCGCLLEVITLLELGRPGPDVIHATAQATPPGVAAKKSRCVRIIPKPRTLHRYKKTNLCTAGKTTHAASLQKNKPVHRSRIHLILEGPPVSQGTGARLSRTLIECDQALHAGKVPVHRIHPLNQ